MPHRVWKHFCPAGHHCGEILPSGELLIAMEVCEECGQTGVFDGWCYSMIEMMCCYQRATGFKPMGPHGKLVHELLRQGLCEVCAGRGLFGPKKPRAWRTCSNCNGNGRYLTGTPEEIAEIQRRIVKEFPDSWAG